MNHEANEEKTNFVRHLWAPDKVHIFISIMPISSPNPTFDHLSESSHHDYCNKQSNIGFGEGITQVVVVEVYLRILSGA